MTCCRSFSCFIFFFVCSLTSLPTGLVPVSSSSSSCWFCPSNSSYLLCAGASAQQQLSSLCFFLSVWSSCLFLFIADVVLYGAVFCMIGFYCENSWKLHWKILLLPRKLPPLPHMIYSHARKHMDVPQRLRKLPWKQCKVS